jgi:O-antigen/teichoic acid export membrane protein
LQWYFDLSVLVAYIMVLPVVFLAPWLIAWAYGPLYAPAASVLAVHAWAAIFVFLGVARSQFLIISKLTRFTLISTLGAALTNVVLNFILIPRWTLMGAAISTIVSYAVSAWLSSFAANSVRPIGYLQSKALLIPITMWTKLREYRRDEITQPRI